ncbi:hypothetical protein [Sphingobacterium deserti]|uniref:Uncharacterized protein n=1 Tax=Sphingobacterium deserti TaxID=1229276 RepID=A0A0B8T388_9SPHI|nr:hypothetical protein [Sphingobacterium deserti]KGE13463.1 hypothetical protein DI53_2748 [Sphingobacterium deserti]
MKLAKTQLTLLLFSFFIFNSCSKDGPSYEELSRLAALKTEEAVALTEGHACGNLTEWRIDTLYYTHVPIHPSFEEQYRKLRAEAQELHRRANDAYEGPTLYSTSMIALPPHFGIRCINGEVKVASAMDLELPEINTRLSQLFTEITTFFEDRPCTDPSKWHRLSIRKDCELIDVLYTDAPNFAVFGGKVEQYVHLEHAKRNLEGNAACSTSPGLNKRVVCENGKPKLIY